MTNTTLIFSGDSNLVSHFHTLMERAKCDKYSKEKLQHWHTPRLCTNPDINFTMTWHVHGFPNHDAPDHWSETADSIRSTDVLNSVPSKGRYIVVVHLYTHYTLHHYRVLYDHLKATRLATESLLKRNPEAVVVFKGPHIEFNTPNLRVSTPIHIGDMMGQLIRQMAVKAFQDLHDRVVYLDLWDMSIAAENKEIHPDEFVLNAMVDFLMDHICPKAQKQQQR